MHRRRLVMLPLLALVALVAFALTGGTARPGEMKGQVAEQAAQGSMRAPKLTMTSNGKTVTRTLPFLSDATVVAAHDALCNTAVVPNCDERSDAADANAGADVAADGAGGGSGSTTTGSGPAHSLGCGSRDTKSGNGAGANFRVNQDCSFRRQAEEDITYNPADPNNLTGGQNDSRVGYNQCGIDWSTDNGKNWGDMLPPFRQRTNHPELMGPNPTNPNDNTINGDPGTGHTYDAGSDPANAIDSQGRAYFSCVVFDVASNASGVFVTESPLGAEGSFYFNVPDAPAKSFMAVEDNSLLVFHDKNMISADRYASSPNRDNVYLTWTVFKFGPDCLGATPDSPGFCESPIFGTMSTDHGRTWSTPQEISGSAPGLCSFGNFFNPALPASDCNFDQGSYSVTLPNGDLEVIFNNGNTANGNPNSQQLGVHCHPTGSSTAGTATMNCAPPVKVGDDITIGEPQCDFGRGPEECIPGAFIRTNDFPRITKDNTQDSHLYAVWQDYRNGEYDIQMSQSLDGGLTWHEVGTVNPDRGLDHYFPATDQSPSSDDRVGVSYYRTQRVPNESSPGSAFNGAGVFSPCDQSGNPPAGSDFCTGVDTGNSDYDLAGGYSGQTPYDFKVISPVFPPPDGVQAGFNGDYSGLTINKGTDAHPIWSDTRNVNPYPQNGVTHDEDVFTDNVGLPNGNAKVGPGTIGQR